MKKLTSLFGTSIQSGDKYYKKALALKEEGRLEESKNVIEEALGHNINHKGLFLLKADYLTEERGYKKAIECYKEAIKVNPTDSSIHLKLGECYYKQKEYLGALECAKKAVELDPDNYLTYKAEGLYHSHSYGRSEAIKCYERADKIAKKEGIRDASIYIGIGDNYFAENKVPDTMMAIEYYDKALKIEQIASTYAKLGACYDRHREGELTVTYYAKAIELDPNRIMDYCYMAATLIDLGRKEKAIDTYNQIYQMVLSRSIEDDLSIVMYNPSYVSLGLFEHRPKLIDELIKSQQITDGKILSVVKIGSSKQDALVEAKLHFLNENLTHREIDPNYEEWKKVKYEEYSELIKEINSRVDQSTEAETVDKKIEISSQNEASKFDMKEQEKLAVLAAEQKGLIKGEIDTVKTLYKLKIPQNEVIQNLRILNEKLPQEHLANALNYIFSHIEESADDIYEKLSLGNVDHTY